LFPVVNFLKCVVNLLQKSCFPLLLWHRHFTR